MSYIVSQTLALVGEFRYWLLFPAVVVEGPIATIIAGLLAAHGELSFWISYLVVVAADTLADLGYYAIGFFGQANISEKFKNRLGITDQKLADLEAGFHTRGGQAFLAGKVFHGPGVAVLVAAGASRFSVSKFLLFNMSITIVKSLLLLLVGFYFGEALGLFQRFLDVSSLILLGVAIIIGVALYYKYRRKKKYEDTNSN